MVTTKKIEVIMRSIIRPRKDDNGGGMIWKNTRKMKEQQKEIKKTETMVARGCYEVHKYGTYCGK
jgi:hypothetical protein